ncbi:hypothetical protein BJ741DRAFT_654381 [Chytriomyces cf. hyalinus JEL632]|nr:hypothetical protein BJ741DRAFT_654381 [Chytriomyces cf. hyalinus JEL632]
MRWKKLRGGTRGVRGISAEMRSAFESVHAAAINEAREAREAGSLPTATIQRGKRRHGSGGHQQAQAVGSSSGNDWDEGFEDFNDGAGDGIYNQDFETGNNADDEFDEEAAFDESNNMNTAFDAYTKSLSKQVKVERKTWAAGRKQRAHAWESNRSENVLSVMEANWPSVEGKPCGVRSCSNPASIACKTCRLQCQPCQFCEQHAILTHNQPAGHIFSNSHGDRWTFPSMRILTCQCTPTVDSKTIPIKLHSLHGVDNVEIITCGLHSYASILCRAGYFPSAPIKPAAAFSFEILEITLKFQNEKSNKVSNYGAAMALFNHQESQYMNKVHDTVYKQFNECLNEYSIVKHLFQHCRFTSGIVKQFGVGKDADTENGSEATTTLANTVSNRFKPPRIFANDGNFQMKHKSPAFGGGGSHVSPGFYHYFFNFLLAKALFITSMDSMVDEKAIKTKPKEVCDSTFLAGETKTTRDARCDVNGVFGSCCRHCVLSVLIDIPKGEKLSLYFSALKHVQQKHPPSPIISFYDIMCKADTHYKTHQPRFSAANISPPYIGLMPILHAYAHGKACQLQYSGKLIMGAGTFDGEVIERYWAYIANHIGRTQRQTIENRADAIFLMVEHAAVDKNKLFCKSIEKWCKSALDKITAIKLDVLEASDGSFAIKPYRQIVQANRASKTRVGRKSSSNAKASADTHQKIMGQLTNLITQFNNLPKKDDVDREIQALVGAESEVEHPGLHLSAVRADLTVQIVGGNPNAVQEQYWRRVEDIYHHCLDLQRGVEFFKSKMREYDDAISRIVESVLNGQKRAAALFFLKMATQKAQANSDGCFEAGKTISSDVANAGLSGDVAEVESGFMSGML